MYLTDQENMPYDAFTGFNFTQKDYLSGFSHMHLVSDNPNPEHPSIATDGNGTYTYYVRKHNGLIVFDSVANVSTRALRIRNCECFDI